MLRHRARHQRHRAVMPHPQCISSAPVEASTVPDTPCGAAFTSEQFDTQSAWSIIANEDFARRTEFDGGQSQFELLADQGLIDSEPYFRNKMR